jgi:molybdopterin-guanine dinucleotide biosynthesis protein A
MKNISGVILAGGANKRFQGITKSKIIIGGRTIISRINDIIDDVFSEKIIVTNTPEEFKEFNNYKLTSDEFLNVGPLGGIHAALHACSGDAVFVFAGDMPFLDIDLIIRQIDLFCSTECEILVPVVNNYCEPLHALYNLSVLNRLDVFLSGDHKKAVKEFFKHTDVSFLHLEDTEKTKKIFTNINSPSDIINIEKYMGIM